MPGAARPAPGGDGEAVSARKAAEEASAGERRVVTSRLSSAGSRCASASGASVRLRLHGHLRGERQPQERQRLAALAKLHHQRDARGEPHRRQRRVAAVGKTLRAARSSPRDRRKARIDSASAGETPAPATSASMSAASSAPVSGIEHQLGDFAARGGGVEAKRRDEMLARLRADRTPAFAASASMIWPRLAAAGA